MPISVQPNNNCNDYINVFHANNFLMQINERAAQQTMFNRNHTIIPALSNTVATSNRWYRAFEIGIVFF